MVAEELQLLYARSQGLRDARRRLWRILDRCIRSDVPELLHLARTLDAWTDEPLAYWTPTGRHECQRHRPPPAGPALPRRVRLPRAG